MYASCTMATGTSGSATVLWAGMDAVVIASVLSAKSGLGAEPLVIVGVVVSYIVTVRLSSPQTAASGSTPSENPAR